MRSIPMGLVPCLTLLLNLSVYVFVCVRFFFFSQQHSPVILFSSFLLNNNPCAFDFFFFFSLFIRHFFNQTWFGIPLANIHIIILNLVHFSYGTWRVHGAHSEWWTVPKIFKYLLKNRYEHRALSTKQVKYAIRINIRKKKREKNYSATLPSPVPVPSFLNMIIPNK